MIDLSPKEIEIFSNKILEDYDNKNPGSIFKEKKRITNEDALHIQSNVARLRQKRGEEVIGYKIGCISKDTQKKMGFNQPASGYLWNTELHKSGATLNKKNFTVIQCKIKSIEWLYLEAKGHRRAKFDIDNNKNSRLVP